MPKSAISQWTILKHILLAGAKSRRDLAASLGVSKATITQGVNKLIEVNAVEEGAFLNETRPGRKTISLRIRPDLAYFVGTDMEGRALRACVVNCAGRVVTSAKRAVGPGWSKANISKQWIELIQDVVRQSAIEPEKIAGIGAGLPGTVDREGFSTRAYLPPGQWVDFGVKELADQLRVNMTVANNVVCVSEFEFRRGAAVGASDFISVLVRYGIGACLYLNGVPLVEQKLETGELGHMRINVEGPTCICGHKGCLDVYASGRTWPGQEELSQGELTRVLHRRARYISVALANVLKLVHPPLIIMNGLYNDYEPIVKPVITQMLEEELEPLKLPVPRVVFGEPVELKTSIGAAMRAADAFLEMHLSRQAVAV